MNAFAIVLLMITYPTWARRAPVQLMPVGGLTHFSKTHVTQVAVLERKGASTPTATARYTERSPYDRPASQFGVELGIVGRKQSTDSDILGIQSLLGARGFLWLPVYRAFTLKPSIGYFFKKERVGNVSVTQNHMEGGLGVLATVLAADDVKWHLGVSNRVTRASSTSTIYSNSSSGPTDLFFRSGPTTGLLVRLGGRIHLAADFEITWSFERPSRTYLGLTSGIGFEL